MAGVNKIIWNLKTLVDNTVIDDIFLSKLIEKGLLTDNVIKSLQNKNDSRKFPYSIFLEIDKKGGNIVTRLVDILLETGNMRAAKILDRTVDLQKVERVPVSRVDSEHKTQMDVTAENSLFKRINTLAQRGNIDDNERTENKEQQEIVGKSENTESIAIINNKENVSFDPENQTIIATEDVKEILEVKVLQGTEYFIDEESIYSFGSDARGMAVIINNDKFTDDEDYPTRTGSQVDVRNLSDLFKQLGLEVLIRENLTRKETLNFLIDFSSDEAHNTADMMIFCMATHGPDRSTLMSADCREIDIETDILRSDKEFCYVSYINHKTPFLQKL